MGHSKLEHDMYMGRYVVDFTELKEDEKVDSWIYVHGAQRNNTVGRVLFSMTFVPV